MTVDELEDKRRDPKEIEVVAKGYEILPPLADSLWGNHYVFYDEEGTTVRMFHEKFVIFIRPDDQGDPR
ncbi:hypothetical protein [Spirillospora sp. NPDC047279]|uniref:hypothetical protein n=1 Tax=Spirillospora sp. NPDC047279 TaxID=3155478 RepID=UPI0033E12A68